MMNLTKNLKAMCVMLCLALALTSEATARQGSSETEALAKQYLAKYEPQLRATTDTNAKFYLLSEITPAAFAAGELGKAKTYSLDLLKQAASFKQDWNYGNAIHVANLVLGRVALVSGELN